MVSFPFLAEAFQLLVVAFQLLAVAFQLLVVAFQLLVVAFQLLAEAYQLLVEAYYLVEAALVVAMWEELDPGALLTVLEYWWTSVEMDQENLVQIGWESSSFVVVVVLMIFDLQVTGFEMIYLFLPHLESM